MEMKGSRTVPGAVETTWRALNDPEVLRACIPGCESIERVSDGEYKVAMVARVGPVSARFTGRLLLADLIAPTSYTLKFEGQGGAAGFANGSAKVALAAADNGTRIDYAASAQVGGKLAQIGSRLVDGAAAKVADDFFARFVERVGAQVPASAAAPAKSTAAPSGIGMRLAIIALIIIVIAVYWWLQTR